MAFDLHAVQKDIETMLTTAFPQYHFYRNTIPEDEVVPRQGEEANPFFVLQFGQLYQVTRGKSMAGARNDEYSSWVQIIGMGSVEEDVADSLALPVDRLIGYKPVGATVLGTPRAVLSVAAIRLQPHTDRARRIPVGLERKHT
jgi:hypothetical protein